MVTNEEDLESQEGNSLPQHSKSIAQLANQLSDKDFFADFTQDLMQKIDEADNLEP